MKAKRTMRDIKSQYPTIIQVSYCDAQNMLCMDDPAAYTAGVYGWNADIYPITSGVAICTGYRPFGTSSPIGRRSSATKSGRGKCDGTCGTLRSWRHICTACRWNLFRRYAKYDYS